MPDKNTVISDLEQVFQTVFDDERLRLGRETTAADIDGWDSLQHVSLMLAVEARFGLRFSSAEVADLKNVGELVDIVAARRTKA